MAKVGFGTLIHKTAKLRTAEDVWISSVKHSDGVQPALKGSPEAVGSQSGARRDGANNHAVPASGTPAR